MKWQSCYLVTFPPQRKKKTKYFVAKESLYDNIPLHIVELASKLY